MKKAAVHPELLPILVSAYNQSIQTYHYFPEVVICGRLRIEKEAFDQLLANDFVVISHADSFGRYYHISKKGEDFIFQSLFRSRKKGPAAIIPASQYKLPFADYC